MSMNILERYQLALSYKEMSESTLSDWLVLVQKKTFDQTHYDLVKATYDRHIKDATELCTVIYNAQKNSIDDLIEAVEDLTRQQNRLVVDTQAGRLKPQKANEQGRMLANDKHRIQTTLDTARTIVYAESTADIGGYIDLSFEDYRKKLDIVDTSIEKITPIDNETPKPRIKPKNVMLLVIAGVLIFLGVDYLRTNGKASWTSEVTDHRQYVQIKCTNTGDNTIRVYVPWDGGNTSPEANSYKIKRISFGALLYVKEKGNTQYQLLPQADNVWIVDGVPHSGSGPITLNSQKRLNIKLDTLAIRRSGINVESVKVEITRYGGRTVFKSAEVLLP